MSGCSTFRSQLLSVMDVLVQAAVAEICKLVDDGYALLRLEVSQSQEQNEVLRRKLHLMELMMAQGCVEEEINLFPAISVPVDGHLSPVEDEDSKFMEKSVRQDANFVLIKQENDIEEDLEHRNCHEALGIVGKSAELHVEEGSKATPEQERTAHSVWEDCGLDSTLKAEPENEMVNQRLEGEGSEHSVAEPRGLDCEYRGEDPSRLNSLFTQQSAENKTKEEACCYATDTTSQRPPVSSGMQSVCEEWKVADSCLSSPGSLSMKQGEVIDSELFKVEVDLNFEWDYSAISRTIHTQHEHCKESRQGESLNANMNTALSPAVNEDYTESKSSSTDTNKWDLYNSRSATLAKSNSDGGTEREGLICAFCGKSFTCQNVFEAHQRIHTGGKPFSCTHCDKTFSQLSNLITHKRVHTGEKPYCCSHCGKQFAQSRYLVTHQRVHTGEKPFKCKQCGKKFAQSSNLIRHQSVHTGKKPFRCSQCGKCFTTSSHRKRHESVHYGQSLFTSTVQ